MKKTTKQSKAKMFSSSLKPLALLNGCQDTNSVKHKLSHCPSEELWMSYTYISLMQENKAINFMVALLKWQEINSKSHCNYFKGFKPSYMLLYAQSV